MTAMNLAVVTKVLPDRHGVLVAWRDHTAQVDNGSGWGFCRVLAPRAHPYKGSVANYPTVGELGLVASIDDEVHVWMGSLHWQELNAIPAQDPDNLLTYWHHDSGATFQMNQEGECQIDLPGGLQIVQTNDGIPMDLPAGTSFTAPGGISILPMIVNHPSGLSITISPYGDVSITDATTINATSGGTVDLTAYGAVSIQTQALGQDPNAALDTNAAEVVANQPDIDITIGSGANVNITAISDVNVIASGNVSIVGAAVSLMSGAVEFVMQPFVDYITNWLALHTHTAISLGSPTSPPIDPVIAPPESTSGSTLTGVTAE